MFNSKFAFKMQVTDNNIGELFIYDSVEPDRKNWEGDIIASETDANRIREKLDAMDNISELKVYISSNGGDVKTGLAIYSMLKRKNCKKTAYIDGFAFSIASVIPMACDEIIMYPTSLLMIHNASACCYGNAEEHRKFADDLDTISASAVTAYLDKAGDKLDRDTLNELLNKESYLSADECLKYGLCDRIESIQASRGTQGTDSNMYDDVMILMNRIIADQNRKASDPKKASDALYALISKLSANASKDEGVKNEVKDKEEHTPEPDASKNPEDDKSADITVTDKADMLASAFLNSFFR